MFDGGGGGGGGVCVCVCVHETTILVAIHFSMKNIYQLCDLGRAVMWSNVGVSQ